LPAAETAATELEIKECLNDQQAFKYLKSIKGGITAWSEEIHY